MAPCEKVYNAIIYALAKEKLVKEACNLVEQMGANARYCHLLLIC